MTNEERELQRKFRVLRQAEQSGHVSKMCRYFGTCRASFYRWRAAYLNYHFRSDSYRWACHQAPERSPRFQMSGHVLDCVCPGCGAREAFKERPSRPEQRYQLAMRTFVS